MAADGAAGGVVVGAKCSMINEQGTIEQGTIEQGTIEQGTIEQGAVEQGAVEQGTRNEV